MLFVAKEGRLEVEPDIGPDLAQVLAAQRIITLGRRNGGGSNIPRVERRR